MHDLKNKFLLLPLLLLAVVFAACAGSADTKAPETAQEKNAKVQERAMDKQSALELMFHNFLASVREGASAETLYDFLTDSSEYWLDTLENHARVYKPEDLDTCQFYEAYVILMYRLYEREHLWETEEDRMLYMLLSKSGMLDRFTRLKLGPMKVKNDRGSIGLAKSPEVPIMLFEWDDQTWKLDLPGTIPLITKGIESIAVKKNWTGRKLALYWIEKEYHMTYSRLDESLLEPIGF
jgi:hypothetical protein